MVDFKYYQVLNFRHNNPISKTISTVMGHYWTHSGIVVDIRGDEIGVLEALGTYRDEKYEPKGIYKKFKFLFKIKILFSGKTAVNYYKKTFLERLFEEKRLKVMDFNIDPKNIVYNRPLLILQEYIGLPYDYFSVFSIGIIRILSLFGKNYENHTKTAKKLFCSELVARIIKKYTNYNVLEELGYSSYEEVTPQDISILYHKLKVKKIIK